MPLIWMLAFGFMPVEDGLQVGPDAPHLRRDIDRGVSWSSGAQMERFRARWGDWHVRWDQTTGTPRALVGAGVPLADVDAMLVDLARLGGLRPGQLVLDRVSVRGDKETRHYVQQVGGVPVEGAYLDVHAVGGRVQLVLASLHHVRLQEPALPGEVLVPLRTVRAGDAREQAGALRYALATRHELDGRVEFRDRSGELVHSWSTRLHLDLQTEVRTVGDPLITAPARRVTVTNLEGSEQTDDLGAHSLEAPYAVVMQGDYLDLRDDEVGPGLLRVQAVEDDLLDWDSDLSPAATSVLHHFGVVRDWLEDRRPAHPWLPDQVDGTVRIDGTCNAFYSGGTINFYRAGGNCHDFGRIADVIYHEVGHGIHDYIIESGVFASDISEGSSDYVAATILDDPTLAPNAFTDGGFIRELDTDKFYPEDITGEVHADGLIWGSFMWNLRGQWAAAYGEEVGWRMADELFLETLSYGPTMTDLAEVVIAADDDDGDLSNGTPHGCELIDLLNHHGIGPGTMGYVELTHTPLPAAGSFEPDYPLDFALESFTYGCPGLGLDDESARLFYAVDPPPGATLDDIVFTGVSALHDGAGGYTGAIPRQRAGSEVVYYLSWLSEDGAQAGTSHGGSADGLYRFHVGDREVVWCDDFEAGLGDWTDGPGLPFDEDPAPRWESEWEVGEPSGLAYEADVATSGSLVLGTNLVDDGYYEKSNTQHVLSPVVDVSAANPWMMLLSAQRWLTVEDAKYDQATILAVREDGTFDEVWRNPESTGGDSHLLDNGWVTADHDLRPWFAPDDPLQLAFTLDSDGGLEFGGWTLDDVCVVTLADVPGHYRVRDLEAWNDGGVIALTWTWPFIDPLAQGVLVRGDVGVPSSPEDGVIVASFDGPRWGAYELAYDVDADRFADQFYAVFVTPEADAWPYVDVVDGENAVLWAAMTLPPEPEPEPEDTDETDGVPADSGSPSVEDTAQVDVGASKGCGCASTPGAPWAGLLLAPLWALVGRRRRQ